VRAWELLGETRAPDGTSIRLTRRAHEYLILANGKPLMSSRLHGSEDALATLACGNAEVRDRPRVLVGGLGMGFTLRATLDLLPRRQRDVEEAQAATTIHGSERLAKSSSA
jgi:spermidine synthase